ncbi:ABC transporter ATP-binding protein [Metabacillus fastidiosus]|uniref:ABC transporter ATP-binding protein n=1 Tax=Metabacillus fastidiosus TaxID=1458 RepID=UPI0008248271|nr:ABC transporter ATP-binding protein [Metabacillus fastidiosus]MED4461040.1 ABC transporter ATP-binding protein [Metabacillus fastidiosus]
MTTKVKKAEIISLNNINKSYNDMRILQDISLFVEYGEFVSIIGPSGSGKSTLFNIITGLTDADSGDQKISTNIGYMQQKDLLLPWKTVMDNICLPLQIKGVSTKEARQIVKQYLDMTGLRGYENKYPNQLSGGMRQRASFLRTFLTSQDTMLLDEPFGALDSITKSKMQKWLLEIKEKLNITILFITHDIEEAIFLSDRIYVLGAKPGIIKSVISLDFHKEEKTMRLVSNELLETKNEILKLL